jgi:hypothetical protein
VSDNQGEPVDVGFMAREITQNLIDMVLEQDEKHQGPLLAHIIGSLSDDYLERGATTSGINRGPPLPTNSGFDRAPRISKTRSKAWAWA